MPGQPVSLSQVLGLEEEGGELSDGQSVAEQLAYELVWQIVERDSQNADGDYLDGLSKEQLTGAFSPESDFYLDVDGNVVFFIQAGEIAGEIAGVLRFPFNPGGTAQCRQGTIKGIRMDAGRVCGPRFFIFLRLLCPAALFAMEARDRRRSSIRRSEQSCLRAGAGKKPRAATVHHPPTGPGPHRWPRRRHTPRVPARLSMRPG